VKASGTRKHKLAGREDSGFSMLEMLSALMIMGVTAAMALPSAVNALRDYKLHTDATAIASYLNVARMRSAAQMAPYRINLNVGNGTYTIEKLCGASLSSVDPACTSSYAAFTTPKLEYGTQYVAQGNTLASCRPAGVALYPDGVTADPSPCPVTLQVYFNTRGSPVDSTGAPKSYAVYLSNQNNMVDAVTLTLGGRAAAFNWSPDSAQWFMR